VLSSKDRRNVPPNSPPLFFPLFVSRLGKTHLLLCPLDMKLGIGPFFLPRGYPQFLFLPAAVHRSGYQALFFPFSLFSSVRFPLSFILEIFAAFLPFENFVIETAPGPFFLSQNVGMFAPSSPSFSPVLYPAQPPRQSMFPPSPSLKSQAGVIDKPFISLPRTGGPRFLFPCQKKANAPPPLFPPLLLPVALDRRGRVDGLPLFFSSFRRANTPFFAPS